MVPPATHLLPRPYGVVPQHQQQLPAALHRAQPPLASQAVT